jgi:4-hydroxybenzoate polyprenyltransferase
VYNIALVYSAFAFIVSLIREVVKDMEDEEGDKKNGCKTMPIVWGIKSTKVFIGVWIIVLFGLLIVFIFNLIIAGWLLGVLYIIFVLLPFLIRIYMSFSKALIKKEYSQISREVKLFMLSGIFSMLIYYFYQ